MKLILAFGITAIISIVHIRHLREKLEDDPAKLKWIITVRGMGYKYQAQPGG
jgi:DNA-binding response OmpR family regulator